MRPPPRLVGCYTPTAPTASQNGIERERIVSDTSTTTTTRRDERSLDALRCLRLESHAAGQTGGTALVELGHTKVLCTVTGPVSASSAAVPSSLLPLSTEQGTLHVETKYAPTTGYPDQFIEVVQSIEAKGSAASAVPQSMPHKQLYSFVQSREADLSARLATALAAVVPLTPYPKCAILLHVTVLQDDGSVLAASVTAATLALVQAGIELYDVVAACSVAIGAHPTEPSRDLLWADPTLDEMNRADCVITIGVLPNWKEVTLWEQWTSVGATTPVSLETTNAAVNLCRAGCRTMHKFMREHLQEQL